MYEVLRLVGVSMLSWCVTVFHWRHVSQYRQWIVPVWVVSSWIWWWWHDVLRYRRGIASELRLRNDRSDREWRWHLFYSVPCISHAGIPVGVWTQLLGSNVLPAHSATKDHSKMPGLSTTLTERLNSSTWIMMRFHIRHVLTLMNAAVVMVDAMSTATV